MLYGGGVAAIETQTATGEGVEATVASNVVNSSVTIADGAVYSLVGGGLAFDNVSHEKASASAHVESLSIVMKGGSLQAMSSKTEEGQEEGQEGGEEDAGDVFFNPQSALADISGLYGGTSVVLGGVAYGEKASSTVDSAELTLEGGTVKGAIFMAALPAMAHQRRSRRPFSRLTALTSRRSLRAAPSLMMRAQTRAPHRRARPSSKRLKSIW